MSLKQTAEYEIYQKIQQSVSTSSISRETIVSILVSLMEMAEQYRSMEGRDKKDIVISTVLQVVGDSTLSEDEKTLLKLIPYGDVIDFVVAASKKALSLNKVSWCC